MSYNDERLTKEKVFRDPVYNYIYIENQIIMDLINTPEFQRLRRIKQLGTASLVFHGAVKLPETGFGTMKNGASPYVPLCSTISVMDLIRIPLNIFSTLTTKILPRELLLLTSLISTKF